MKSSRALLLALALSGALSVTAACDDKNTAGDAAPATSAAATSAAAAPQADPRTELVNAFSKLNSAPMAYSTSTESGTLASTKLTGSADPATKANSGTMVITTNGQAINAQVIVLGTDVYMKMSVPLPGIDPKKWMYFDGSKTSLTKLGLGNPDDPANVKGLADAIVTAERTGTGAFKGTIDLTKRKVPESGAALIQQMGDAAKSVPFEAATNADGYLTSFTMTMPAAGQVPATTAKTTFSDFGKPVTITKPAAAEVQPAPAALLAQLG
ncbi:hypothetical protein AB0M46_44360 [Dactylosporangium sp. NPDC051485]|uniref:hypothetical protein n=1 Tax=Dactylosporangium sp. NPDC051485 TaxID=3154846 RepID=UPI0034468A81